MTGVSRVDLIQNARIFRTREAIVSALKTHFEDIEVRAHPGRIDMADVLAKDVFAAPSIALAITKATPAGRLSGADDVTAEITAYVIARDAMVGGTMVTRDEFALAICEGLLIALSDDDFTHWSGNVGIVEDAVATPVFTMKSFENGTVFYAVTWKQTLYAVPPANFFTGDAA